MIARTGLPRRVTATVAGLAPSFSGSFVHSRRAATVVISLISLVQSLSVPPITTPVVQGARLKHICPSGCLPCECQPGKPALVFWYPRSYTLPDTFARQPLHS